MIPCKYKNENKLNYYNILFKKNKIYYYRIIQAMPPLFEKPNNSYFIYLSPDSNNHFAVFSDEYFNALFIDVKKERKLKLKKLF